MSQQRVALAFYGKYLCFQNICSIEHWIDISFMTTRLLPLPHLPHLPCVLLDVVLLPAVPEAAGAGPDGAADEAVGEDQQGQGEEEIR